MCEVEIALLLDNSMVNLNIGLSCNIVEFKNSLIFLISVFCSSSSFHQTVSDLKQKKSSDTRKPHQVHITIFLVFARLNRHIDIGGKRKGISNPPSHFVLSPPEGQLPPFLTPSPVAYLHARGPHRLPHRKFRFN